MSTMPAGRDARVHDFEAIRAAQAAGAGARPSNGRFEAVLTLVMVVLIGLASLTPFRFDVERLTRGGFGALGWPAWKWSDALLNLSAYLPLGAAAALWLRRVARRAFAVSGALLACGLLSYALESLQVGLSARWPSWVDFALNALGGLAGAVLAVEVAPMLERIVHAFARLVVRWRMGMPSAGLLGLWVLLASVAGAEGGPALVRAVTGTAEFSVQPIPLWDHLHMPATAVVAHAAALGGLFVLLGLVASPLAQRSRRRGKIVLAAVTLVVLALASVSASGCLSSSDAVVAVAALALGGSCARKWQSLLRAEQAAEDARCAGVRAEFAHQEAMARRRAFAEAAPQPVSPSQRAAPWPARLVNASAAPR